MTTIASVPIGGEHPCRFVAELSNNWRVNSTDSDRAMRDRVGRLIDAAKAAGADFVKTQCYTADELVALRGDGPAPEPWGSQGWTMRSLYEYAATPFEWFPHIKAHCERVGIPWFSSVFGAESLALLESLDCPAYKIARLDNAQGDLQRAVLRLHKPLIVSEDPSDRAWRSGVHRVGLDFRLYCPEGYPQTRFALRNAFRTQCDVAYGSPVESVDYDGLSFHGTDWKPCEVAVAAGAKIIESHFQLDDEPSELEANVSLRASDFASMVHQVRRVEAML